MRNRILLFLSAIFGQTVMPAQAMTVQVDADIDDYTDSPDGSSLAKTTSVPVAARTQITGWDLSMTLSYVHVQGDQRSNSAARRAAYRNDVRPLNRGITTGLTDMKISAERSIPLTRKVSLDLLTRLTLPTGRQSVYLGNGRVEAMTDAGISAKFKKTTLWAGGAKRFRSKGYESTGRDITEFYAGVSRELNDRTTMRVDYLRAQSAFRGEKKDQSLTFRISRNLKSGATVEFATTQYNDVFGSSTQGGVTLRWPLNRLL